MAWLPEAFDRAAGANRSRVAVIEEDRQWTFDDLSGEVDRTAAKLRDATGDVIGILLLNSHKYVVALLAIWKAGKTAFPLNYLLPPQELAYIIRDSGMSALISSQFFGQALAAIQPLVGGNVIMADAPDFGTSSPLTNA